MTKLVCIRNKGATKLEVGKVYESKHEIVGAEQVQLVCNTYDFLIGGHFFLRLPEGEKTCDEMTMEEWLAFCCLKAHNPECLECLNIREWTVATSPNPNLKTNTGTKYRIKPEKSAKKLEIEAIEAEMRALAERLNKVKGV